VFRTLLKREVDGRIKYQLARNGMVPLCRGGTNLRRETLIGGQGLSQSHSRMVIAPPLKNTFELNLNVIAPHPSALDLV
jgi:hypothetical protein